MTKAEANYRKNHTPASDARHRAYRLSPRGQARARCRLWFGNRYVGMADSPEQKATIHAHIQRRQREFKQTQRARTEDDL